MDKIFNAIRNTGFHRGPNRIVAGICGGIAERFGLSSGLARLVTLILFLLPGVGLGLYLVLWALTPWTDGTIPLERWLSNVGSRPAA